MELQLPFANQEGESKVTQNSREKLVNMFAEVETSGRSRIIRRQRAGVRSEYTLAGEKRAIEKFGSNHYHVTANKLYSWNGSTNTELATVPTATGRMTMIFGDEGADDILLSDGANMRHWDGASLTTVTMPTSPATGSAVQPGPLAYMSGYGLFNDVGTGQLWWTDVGDLTNVTSTNFATAETHPDPIMRVYVDHGELWLFGKVSTEVWTTTSDSSAPFARISGAQMERGLGATYSVASDDNTVFFLGDDKVVYRVDGYKPLRISTHSIERLIQAVGDITSAEAFVYTIGGNKFFTLRFPSELTVQYNIATGLWNTAKTFGYDDWRLLGSAGHPQDYFLTTAGIVSLESGLSTDESGILQRGGVSAPVYAGGKRISLRSYFLDAEVGRASINTDANVMLRFSRDGETFGNIRTRSLGATGEYTRRAVWRNLGYGRELVVEFYITDPTEFSIMGAGGNLEVLSY